jgi:hypothetical protein
MQKSSSGLKDIKGLLTFRHQTFLPLILQTCYLGHFISPSYQLTNAAQSSVATPPPITPLVVPSLRDVAMKEYSDWQESQVNNQTLKAEFQKAYELALIDGFCDGWRKGMIC